MKKVNVMSLVAGTSNYTSPLYLRT